MCLRLFLVPGTSHTKRNAKENMTRVPIKRTVNEPMVRRVRPRRDSGALEERRMDAADVFERGVIAAEVARPGGCLAQIVSDWRAAWAWGAAGWLTRRAACRALAENEPRPTRRGRT